MNIWLPNHNMYISPAETVDTVNVSTSSFDAEQGMAGGAAVTVVTKSGTNAFSGSGVRVLQQREAERQAVLLRLGRRCPTSCRSRRTITAHDRWSDQAGQAVLLRVVRRLQAEPEPVHLLQRAGCRTARRRLQQGAEHERLAAADLQPVHRQRQRYRARTVREQPDSGEHDQPDRAQDHAARPACPTPPASAPAV